MLKALMLLLISIQTYGAYTLCQNEEMVVRFKGERVIYVAGRGHEFKVEDPKIEIFADKTSYLGKAEYQKSYGNRTLRLIIKKNGSAELTLQMANRASVEAKLTCK